jgi:DNA-binding GntR family transcriptional regulator
LREALHRFAGEGLVEFIPQRGARVAALSLTESSELTELRTLLEPACVRHAIEHPSDGWRSEVKAAALTLQSALTARRHRVATSEHAYRSFYAALTETCDSARLRRYATSVRDQHARYRTATLERIDRRHLAAVIAALAAAAADGDTKAARSAVITDVEQFASTYAESAES